MHLLRCFSIASLCALASCEIPEQPGVAPQPPPPAPGPAAFVEQTGEPAPPSPLLPADDIRLPTDLLSLPKESDLKASSPAVPPTTPGSGAVIATPPTTRREE